jgi:hypothetical protein
VGTVTYMSPERIRGDSYGLNTDVWSLGLLVLECAVGRYPYPPQQQGPAGAGCSSGEAGGAAAAAAPKLGFWELLEYIGGWWRYKAVHQTCCRVSGLLLQSACDCSHECSGRTVGVRQRI